MQELNKSLASARWAVEKYYEGPALPVTKSLIYTYTIASMIFLYSVLITSFLSHLVTVIMDFKSDL